MNAPIDISNVILKTERLVLRPWRRSDLDDFFEYASVPGVGEMAGWGHHKNIEESEAILERFIAHKRTFAIEYRGQDAADPGASALPGKVIGSLGVELYKESALPEFDELKCREIGFVLSKDYWGLGIMPEAVKAVLAWLFNEVGLDLVVCGHFLWNKQSERAQEKCGFRHYAFDDYTTQTGRIEPHEYRIITAAEYKMNMKTIKTGSVNYLELMDGSGLYWGTDCASGDLYEAEEIYAAGGMRKNRLIFVSLADGRVFEPVTAGEGQYFGRPVISGGRVYCLLVDFAKRLIYILRCAEDLSSAEEHAVLPLDEVPDCYNLMLDTEPLTLVRQGHENRFQVVWPDKGDFAIENTESFDCRSGDVLLFSKWFEDPDYREDTVLRRYPGGEVIETLSGPVMTAADGQKWFLER